MNINRLKNIKNDEIPLYSLKGTTAEGKVVSIYDGDTCTIVLAVELERSCFSLWRRSVFQKFKCRLAGLDTPEMKPALKKSDRDSEIHAAHKSRNRLMQLITDCSFDYGKELSKKECQDLVDQNTKIITVDCQEFDKYGRLLVKLFCGDSVSANAALLAEGLATPYDGGAKDVADYSKSN